MNPILFIGDKELFVIKGIVRNLESTGLECQMISWDVKEIKKNYDLFSDIVVAYLDDISDMPKDAIVYLKDASHKCVVYRSR